MGREAALPQEALATVRAMVARLAMLVQMLLQQRFLREGFSAILTRKDCRVLVAAISELADVFLMYGGPSVVCESFAAQIACVSFLLGVLGLHVAFQEELAGEVAVTEKTGVTCLVFPELTPALSVSSQVGGVGEVLAAHLADIGPHVAVHVSLQVILGPECLVTHMTNMILGDMVFLHVS